MKILIKGNFILKHALIIIITMIISVYFARTTYTESGTNNQTKQKQKPIKIAMNGTISENFGKTHFIVGMSNSDVAHIRAQQPPETPTDCSLETICKEKPICRAFFSPDDGIEQILIDLINNETKSIFIAIFAFTDGEVARALIQAKVRGVLVEIVTDPSCLQDKFNKILLLKNQGIPIQVYNTEVNTATLSNRMHHKFVIFGKNIAEKSLIWLGSYNFTKSANEANQESVVLLENPILLQRFLSQFNRLKERSIKFETFEKNHFVMQPYSPTHKDHARKKLQATCKNFH